MTLSYETQRKFFSSLYFILPIVVIPFGFYSWPLLLASLLFYYIVVFLGIECGLHRLLTHNSFKTSKFWEYTLSILPIMLTAGSPIAWTAIHRAHHQKSDTVLDPHSPKYVDLIKLFSVTWSVEHIPLKVGFPKGINFKFQRFIHNHYYKLVTFYIAVLSFIDPAFVIYFWALPSLITHIYQQVVNVVGHNGEFKDSTQDYSTNHKYIGWLFPIIGYHHEHHLHPMSHRLGKGITHGEPDVPAFLIEKVFSRS
jgi:stearoyl-CoA desaturase (delta-9 desaturase)